jgi:S-formylglutathione hydrolase FrmB
VVKFKFLSRLLGRSLDEVVVIPRGRHRRRGLLVLLHGRGSSASQWLSDPLFAELVRLGRLAPALLVVDGGDHSYYHDRGDGPWGSYVLKEAIPAGLARTGADPRRVAIGGISMGGFGALELARSSPGRFCAVGGHSPALWLTAGETAPGAFDDAEDFARHDLVAAARKGRPFGRTPVWLDAGDSDPFLTADREFARLIHVPLYVSPGGHNRSYWHRHAPDYLRFYAAALASC